MIITCENILVMSSNNMPLKSKTQNLLNKIYKKKFGHKDLNLKFHDFSDSLKLMELLVEIEKNTKKKFNPTKIRTIKDVNNLF